MNDTELREALARLDHLAEVDDGLSDENSHELSLLENSIVGEVERLLDEKAELGVLLEKVVIVAHGLWVRRDFGGEHPLIKELGERLSKLENEAKTKVSP